MLATSVKCLLQMEVAEQQHLTAADDAPEEGGGVAQSAALQSQHQQPHLQVPPATWLPD